MTDFADGVYFNLDFDQYVKDSSLGSTDLCDLIVGPGTYWRGSYLDPDQQKSDFDDEAEAEAEKATKAQILGRAYHTARLEPEKFDGLYIREPIKTDFPANGFLSSDEKVKAALKEGGQQQTVSGETTLERCERLIAAGYIGTIWPREKALFAQTAGERQPIRGDLFDKMMIDMERLRANEQIAPFLSGGCAEVSIFWTDKNGIRCKARLDYLKAKSWVDFKTFDNSMGKRLEQCIADAFRFNRYYIQACHYRDGVAALRAGLPIIGEVSDFERALIANLQNRAIMPPECYYIFQEKNGVPHLLARRFEFTAIDIARQAEIDAIVDPDRKSQAIEALSRPTMIATKAAIEIAHAKRVWATYSQVYETGQPWALIDPIGSIGDLDFNNFWLEGR